MDEREKILAKIEQNQTDRQRLCDEGKKLNKELEGLDRPMVRHLDWGLCDYGELRIFVYEGNKFRAYDKNGTCTNASVGESEFWKNGIYEIKGNLLGELRRKN